MIHLRPKVDMNELRQAPLSKNGKLCCCCGFELIKQDEDSFRCTGGNHIYRFSAGSIVLDKFGNYLIKPVPETKTETKRSGGKKNGR